MREPGLTLSGIDRSEEQISAARRSHATLDIDFRCGNGEHLPYEDNAFDILIFLDYLEHVERPAASLAEMRRVLKPGGILHFVCPAEGQVRSVYWLSSRLFRRHFKETTLGHIQQFSFGDIEQLVMDAGFTMTDRRYSYHLLGSVMDYLLFALLLVPRLALIYWTHDKYHANTESLRPPTFASRALNGLMTFGNAIAYAESAMFATSPFLATAIHITARG